MKVEKISVLKLNILSKLLTDYISENPKVSHLYKYERSISEFKRVIEDKSTQNINRDVLSNELLKQYKGIENSELVLENVHLLKDSNTFTITTAHQLCLFTGPLYFIYKAISTIKLCQLLSTEYPNFNFIPVFWLGSEDHDFEEINHLNVFNKKIEWEGNEKGAVGKMQNKYISKTIDELVKVLPKNLDIEITKKLYKIFKSSDNYAKSFFKFLHYLFGNYGLVILEQDNIEFKKLFITQFKDELLNNIVKKTIVSEVAFIDNNYKVQAKPRDINIFYMIDGLRERIIEIDSVFIVNNSDISFNQNELLEELDYYPERFSPNVLLRPLYQESILPNLAYVGGGGEMAYWLQLQSLFDSQKINFPMLLLRDMALQIDPKTSQNIEKLSIDKKCLFLNKDQLISKLVEMSSSEDLNIEIEVDKLEKLFDVLLKKALNVDKNIEKYILAEKNKALKSLSNIQRKMLRSEKRKNVVLTTRVNSIFEKLFPNKKLQERHDNFLPYFSIYGFKYFDFLLQEFNPLDSEMKIIVEE